MDTIKNYIESLFLGIIETEQTKRLKEELLAGAEDRYEDLKSQGKTENEAIGHVIAEFGTIDELLEEMDLKQQYESETGHEINEITAEEAAIFLEKRRKGALRIGFGVLSIMLGVAGGFILESIYGNYLAGVFGLLLVLMGVAIGVLLFILAGTSLAAENEKLKDRFIPLAVRNEMKKRKELFQRSFVFCMALGVVLCIVSVFPVLVLQAFSDSIRLLFFSIALLLAIAGFGVFFLIYGGVIRGSFTKMSASNYLIFEGQSSNAEWYKKKEKEKFSWGVNLFHTYWPTVTAIFLLQGFLLGNWGSAWQIFPIAGIVYGLLRHFFSSSAE